MAAADAPQRRDGRPRLEAPHQLLQHEDRPGDGRVEGGGEAGARAGRQERPAVGPVAAERHADQVGQARPHLHARPFAAQGQS